MALKIVKGRTLPIGVDLGTSSVKLAQLRRADGEVELAAAASADIPRDSQDKFSRRLDAACKSIRIALKDQPFRGRQAIIAVPAEQTFVQHVKIPKVAPGEVAEAVRNELSGKLPFPAETAVIRHVIAGDVQSDTEPRQEVIAVAAARKTLDAYLDMARKAKLDVVAINIEPCAIVECFGRLFRRAADAERTTLFIDMGTSSTQVVLAHGNRIAFARNLSHGSRAIEQALAQAQQCDDKAAHELRGQMLSGALDDEQVEQVYTACESPLDALAAEMTQCMRYYESVFHGRRVDRAIFVGGLAYDKRLCQSLARRLDLPAQIGDPLVRVKSASGLETAIDRAGPQPGWAVAVGLSLGGSQAA